MIYLDFVLVLNPAFAFLWVYRTYVLSKEVKTVSLQMCPNHNEKAIEMPSRSILVPSGCLGRLKRSSVHFGAASSQL